MLESCAALDGPRLDAIEALAARVVAHDGGRLKLEPAALAREQWPRALWWRDGRLVGFAGVYRFGAEPEIAGMVDPLARRQGIARAVLTDLVPRAAGASVLLVCPRTTDAGAAFARSAGAMFEHSEHALHLLGEPLVRAIDGATTLRPARPDDRPAVVALLDAGFGLPAWPAPDSTGTEHLVVERAGAVVGYVRASLHGDEGGVHGFVVARSLRGRGIGRDVLGRTCRRLRSRGAARIGLEVAVDNESALGLYTSLGFVPVVTEDYYRLHEANLVARLA